MSSCVQIAGATTLSPPLLAGALVFASRHLEALGLPHPTHAQILAATGAGSTRAYARAQDIEAALRTLDRPVGRPRKASPPPPASSSREELQTRLLAFLLEHPGCVARKQQRRSYSDELRRFLVALHEEYREHLSFEEFARVVQIPEKTLRPWLRVREDASPAHADGVDRDDVQSDEDVHERIHVTTLERLAAAWDAWTGSFEAFFRYARGELGVTAGKDHIRNVLEALRARPVHRRGPAPDQTALRQSFETFFPGAQWVGDGTELTFTLNGQPFTCHLELFVDADSAALAGAAVRDQEDSAAVIDAFRDGAATTGFPPIAALLDNRPSNHTDDVHAALDPSLPIRATRGRAQNKAHVEGSFGLFSRTAPLLSLHASTPRELAVGVIELVVTTWARTLNHKPRPSRGGLSQPLRFGSPVRNPATTLAFSGCKVFDKRSYEEWVSIPQRAHGVRAREVVVHRAPSRPRRRTARRFVGSLRRSRLACIEPDARHGRLGAATADLHRRMSHERGPTTCSTMTHPRQ